MANQLGGERVLASGALPGNKGDVRLEKFLADSKGTERARLTLSISDVTKHCRDAREVGLWPMFIMLLKGTPSSVPSEWVAIPLSIFQEMLDQNLDKEL